MERHTRKIMPTTLGSINVPLLTELGRRLGVLLYKHAIPTELIPPILIPLKKARNRG
jgi:hypothetical protein